MTLCNRIGELLDWGLIGARMRTAIWAVAAYLIVSVHPILITIQTRTLVGFMLHKHPVNTFAAVV